jgi:hypothetical protein
MIYLFILRLFSRNADLSFYFPSGDTKRLELICEAQGEK